MVDNPQLAPNIRELLATLRQRIRRYVWLEGIAGAAAWLGVAFWVSLALDWFLEPPPFVRALVIAAALAGLAWVVFAMILRRVFVRMSDANMAMLLERRYPHFHDSLLTAVELTAASDVSKYNPHLLDQTCTEAERSLEGVRAEQVLNPSPLRRTALAAGLFALSVIIFALAWPDLLGVWARRTFAMSDELWPRSTRLVLEGFEDGVAKVAKGSDLEVVVKAELGQPPQRLVVPAVVEILYREGGSRSRKAMNREGSADPQRDQFQDFSYTFRSLLSPVTFDVVGGDDALRGYRIEVVDNPTIASLDLDCEYPKYMGLAPRSFHYTSLMQFPVGSRLTLLAKTNKDLRHVQVEAAGDPSQRAQKLAPDDPAEPRSFHYTVERLAKDTTLLFVLFDADGIKSREPVRVALAAIEDQRPEFAVQLRGIGSAITAEAQLPAVGRVTDDHGLARIWYEHAVDKDPPGVTEVASPPGNATEFPLNRQTLDARKLNLKPGQKLLVCLKAADRCDLRKGPNVGTSDRWLLEVVTADQLRTMLQARELVLRQRFESVIRDVTELRETVAKVDFSASGKPEKPAEKPAEKRLEPGEKPEPERTPEQLAGQRRVYVEWAAQNSVKNAHEVAGVADAISEIREELVNNRIDTEELKARLEQGIADPLRRVAGEMFPELDRRLDQLQTLVDNHQAGPDARARALAQVDAIVLEMRQVLGRMLELEDFNEAVKLLRAIIEEQHKVHDATQKQQKERLRNLLE